MVAHGREHAVVVDGAAGGAEVDGGAVQRRHRAPDGGEHGGAGAEVPLLDARHVHVGVCLPRHNLEHLVACDTGSIDLLRY